MSAVPALRKLADDVRGWLDAPTLEAAGRLTSGVYGAASFLFFVSSGPATLDRALVQNALTDAEHRKLVLFLVIGIALAAAFGVHAARRSREALARMSYGVFLAAPLALWPLYEAVPLDHVRLVSAAAMAALAGFALHGFATKSASGRALFDRLDAPSSARIGGVIALVLGLAHGAAMGWIALAMGRGATGAMQCLALGAAALPLYAVAVAMTRQTTLALLVTTAFLLHPCTPAIAGDGRPLPFALLLAGVAWAGLTERRWPAIALFAGALVARADAGVYLAALSLTLVLEGKLAKIARWGLVVAAGWLVVSTIASGAFESRLVNPLSVIDAVTSQPDKWRFVALSLLPVAFLPFVTARGALLVVPALAGCLLSTVPGAWSIEHLDAAPLLVLASLGAIAGIARFREPRTRTVLAMVMVIATVLVSGKFASEPVTNGPRVARDLRAAAGVGVAPP